MKYVKDKMDYLQGCVCSCYQNYRHGLITRTEKEDYVAWCKEVQKSIPHIEEAMSMTVKNIIAFAIMLLISVGCIVMFNLNCNNMLNADTKIIFCGNIMLGGFCTFVLFYLCENIVSFINHYIDLHYV